MDCNRRFHGQGPRRPLPKGSGAEKHEALLLLVPFPVILALLPAPDNVVLHSICLVAAARGHRAYILFGNKFFCHREQLKTYDA